ncbi:proteasome maturation factor UMP1 family protein [Heterostelium album PN500]|uniref:Proteasome maturation factor UMP1 family protein n=1 Tax=Heterostelium pallidum (strain ATCC 26659 / Pp 5 / PN500) TaxID=670386 RepID=D3BRL4_HETP5|nr:proteasome maturation factor UMP1 family protein [Heterostelium album PN500]EFA76046.1 proteasome maturation factor UMP1 family protein [Heterostelium album PN500]|eukprot:XP_020428180.1 proteasome maturation factor UMP1 family protein [Heterostelium album PN500]
MANRVELGDFTLPELKTNDSQFQSHRYSHPVESIQLNQYIVVKQKKIDRDKIMFDKLSLLLLFNNKNSDTLTNSVYIDNRQYRSIDHMIDSYVKMELNCYKRNDYIYLFQESVDNRLKNFAVSNVFGQQLTMHYEIEKQIYSQFRRLPTLPSSMVGLETVLGLDEDFDFADFLNDPMMSEKPLPTLHDAMEIRLGMTKPSILKF